MVIEHLRKYTKNRSLIFIAESLNINIEQNCLGLSLCGTINQHKGCRVILKLFTKTLHTANAFYLFIFQKVGKHFQEVRFTTSKETGNPNTHIGCRLVESITVIVEERNEMFLQFSGNDIFI